MALSEKVAEAAAAAGYRLVEADAWLAYGESVSLIDGRERESLPYIRRATELAPQSTVGALARLTAGEILKFCGEIDQAADAYSDAVTVFESLSDAWGECLARYALSEVLVSLGRAEEATPHLVFASALAMAVDEPAKAAEWQWTLGQHMSGSKRYPEVISPLRAAAELARMIGSRTGDIAIGGSPGFSGSHAFTLEGWFKKTGKLQNQVLVDIGQAGTGNIAGLTIWSSAAATSPITTCPHLARSVLALDSYGSSNCWNTAKANVDLWDEKWRYLALVYNASDVSFTAYADGIDLGSQRSQARPLNLHASHIRIGNWVDTIVNQPFIGEAGDIAVYPTALPAATIKAHWRGQLGQ